MGQNLDIEELRHGTDLVKRGFARMQKGGVVMDVTTPEEARVAEEAGAVAVMALERVPADLRAEGGVARMSSPEVIEQILDTVTIPVMAKARIGHSVEAQLLEELGVDMIDESEVLTPADPFFHIDKQDFDVPFVCGATNLGEAVRRIYEGAAMIRTKGEAGTGNIVEAVRHRRLMQDAIDRLDEMGKDELYELAEHYAEPFHQLQHSAREEQGLEREGQGEAIFAGETGEEITEGLFDVLVEIRREGRLPVVDFAAGGIATPADASLMMQLGNDGVFVGSGIFKSQDPEPRARAIVEATTHFDEADRVVDVSKGLGSAMSGQNVEAMDEEEKLQARGT
ncbi:pyridoxal 5'-phosphate synthase lyase subunit PdxS [Thermoplasmatales archaeon SW_10_69_26]|nr:MAG: pyridoxal 5'-phosphate synthase lyase subunit PdxS [Thermoplasmatales archaeon SW_10_69_26]